MLCSLLTDQNKCEFMTVRLPCHTREHQPHLEVRQLRLDVPSDIGRPATYLKVRVRIALLPVLA